MKDLIKRFEASLSYGNKGTAKTYLPFVRDFLAYIKKPVDKVTSLDVTDWFQHLQNDKGYDMRTVKVGAYALKRFYKIMGLPQIRAVITIPQIDHVPAPKWLEEDVCFKFIGKIPVLCVAYDLALRIGEVSKLKVEMLNLKTGQIEVIRLKHKGHPNEYELTLDPWCLDIIKQYLQRSGITKGNIFPYSVMTINKIFRQRRKMFNLSDGYTFHCLRHSRITHIAIHELKEKGTVDIVSLAKFAGHLKLDMTLAYIHLASKYLTFKR